MKPMPHGRAAGNVRSCARASIVLSCPHSGGSLPTKPESERHTAREYVSLTQAEREAFGRAATAAHQSKAGLLRGFVVKLCKDGGWL